MDHLRGFQASLNSEPISQVMVTRVKVHLLLITLRRRDHIRLHLITVRHSCTPIIDLGRGVDWHHPRTHLLIGSPPYHHQMTHHGHRGGESEEEFLAGPGPSSFQNQAGSHRPPLKPIRHKKIRPRPNGGPSNPQHFRPEGGGSSENSQYIPTGHELQQQQSQHSQPQHYQHQHPQHQHQPNKPIVLKVSSKKTRPTNLPPPPPPFYAPSPDLVASQKVKTNSHTSYRQN